MTISRMCAKDVLTSSIVSGGAKANVIRERRKERIVMDSKYHAQPAFVNGIRFASEKEAARYWDLLVLQRVGKISDLRIQVPYELVPAQRIEGKVVERPVKYVADFVYTEDGKTVVEDAKGMRTKEYIIKRKLMLWIHGIRIKET